MKCVTQSVGMDISPNMVAKYNQAMKDAGLSHDDAYAVEGDLLNPEGVPESLSTPELHGFDIAAIGLGFHHFEKPALAVHRLAERLNPGGVILIVDGAADGHSKPWQHHEADHTISTPHGFSEDTMKQIFEDAGLEGVGYHVMEQSIKLGAREESLREVKIFFGRAQKKCA